MRDIKNRLMEMSERISEINEFFNTYNISDKDSITSVREEVDTYKKELKKITDEKLK